MRKVQDYIYNFFTQFLTQEISPNILPTMRKVLNIDQNKLTGDSMETEEIHLFEQILNRLDKSKSGSNTKML
jgi:hypothetical protein